MLTIRGELARRLNSFRKAYPKKRVSSYAKALGIGGPISKDRNKPFNGFGIDGYRYKAGYRVNV